MWGRSRSKKLKKLKEVRKKSVDTIKKNSRIEKTFLSSVRFFRSACLGLLIGSFACAPETSHSKKTGAVASEKAKPIASYKQLGRDWVSLNEFARYYGLKLKQSGEQVSLKSKWTTIDLEPPSRITRLNGQRLWLSHGMQKHKNGWALAKADVLSTYEPLLRSTRHLKPVGDKKGRPVVLLDPGHGGNKAGGRSSGGLEEKTLSLKLANLLKPKLEKLGYQVLLTRSRDQSLGLAERVRLAAKHKADLLVSLHFNMGASTARGIETFVVTLPGLNSTHSPNDPKPDKTVHPGNKHQHASQIAGWDLHRGMIASTKAKDRGLKRARFLVLRDAPCPAVLIEGGFLSNPAEAKILSSKTYHEKLAVGLANGIKKYFDRVKAVGT